MQFGSAGLLGCLGNTLTSLVHRSEWMRHTRHSTQPNLLWRGYHCLDGVQNHTAVWTRGDHDCKLWDRARMS